MKKEITIQKIGDAVEGVSKSSGREYYFLPMVVSFREEYHNGESAEHTLMGRTNKKVDLDKLRLYEGTNNTLEASIFFNVRSYTDKNGNERHDNEINIYLPKELYL